MKSVAITIVLSSLLLAPICCADSGPPVTHDAIVKCQQYVAKMQNTPMGMWTPNDQTAVNNCQMLDAWNHNLRLSKAPLFLRKPIGFFVIGKKSTAEEIIFTGDGVILALQNLEYDVAEGPPKYDALDQRPVIIHTGQSIIPVLFKDGTFATYPPGVTVVIAGDEIGLVKAAEFAGAIR